MSQYPTQPPTPPPGQPPQPGYYAPGTPGAAPTKTSGAAIGSLIAGILSCIPFVSIVAVILGIVGIRATNRPGTGGKGLAIAGLVLGILGLIWTLGFIAMGGGIWGLIRATQGERNYAAAFVKDIAAGNPAALRAKCAPSITDEELKTLIEQTKAWGAVSDVTTPIAVKNTEDGKTVAFASGAATYGQGTKHTFMMSMEKPAGANEDAYKVTGFSFPELTAAQIGKAPTKPGDED